MRACDKLTRDGRRLACGADGAGIYIIVASGNHRMHARSGEALHRHIQLGLLAAWHGGRQAGQRVGGWDAGATRGAHGAAGVFLPPVGRRRRVRASTRTSQR